ncbi:MAG: MutS-related protein [Holdemania massiliensis]
MKNCIAENYRLVCFNELLRHSICCEEAEIPLFDQVFVDIGDDQSIVQSLSTFSAHLSKLADITGHATKKSLVLLDELGSGTDPKEGESLAIAVLNDLREKGCLSVVTTHYGRLKLYGKRHEDILVASVQFDVEKMMPTYHFIEGLSGQSNAFENARRFGLKEKIIREAEFLKRQQRSQEDELIEKLEAQILQNQQLKEKQEALIAQTEQRQKQLEQELNRLSAEKQKILDTAEKQAQKHLEEIKEEGEALLEELRQSEKTMKL